MSAQHIETLIIGAGQSGLATGYHLARHDRPFLIVDGGDRVGDSWRHQYDSLRLFTPAYADGLPGMPFPAAKWDFPTKDEVAAYLESYAVAHDLPVRLHTRVDRIAAHPGGGYIADLGADQITCDNVVVATGTFGRTPYIPDIADRLAADIVQVHSADYRNPEQLPAGPVLVVGASHSGCDIAYELAQTRPTTLCGPDHGQLPMRWGSRRMKVLFPVLRFAFAHVLNRRTPIGRKAMTQVRHHGAPMLRVQRSDLAERGVTRTLGRVAAVSPDGRPVLDDGSVVDVATVLWCTGYRQVFDWIDLPILGDDGWPREYRGVVDGAPGLYFCGLSFQYAFSSMEIAGVGRDSDFIARQIVDRTRRGTVAPSAA